jgi:hypothetical protein
MRRGLTVASLGTCLILVAVVLAGHVVVRTVCPAVPGSRADWSIEFGEGSVLTAQCQGQRLRSFVADWLQGQAVYAPPVRKVTPAERRALRRRLRDER